MCTSKSSSSSSSSAFEYVYKLLKKVREWEGKKRKYICLSEVRDEAYNAQAFIYTDI